MQYEIIPVNTDPAVLDQTNSPSAINNRLEALKVLSQSLLREVEALKSTTKPDDEFLDEVQQGKIDLEKEVQKYELI